MSANLSFAQANAICRNWISIGENALNWSEGLRKEGFSAFVARNAFLESFARGDDDILLHRRCVAETIKERLGQPGNFPISDDDFKDLYFSPFLQELRRQRDLDNGCSERDLSSRFGGGEAAWRREVDPCLRSLVQDSVLHRSEHEVRFQEVLRCERKSAEDEAELHASEIARANDHVFDEEGRYSFFAAVMERDAAMLGFHYDKARSRRNRPVFSKPVVGDWRLYWLVGDRNFFNYSPREGRFAPTLYLRSSQVRKEKIDPGQVLTISYASAVDGLSVAYWAFSNFSQLERAIRAHLLTYGLVASTIEGGIQKVLEGYA